MKFEGEIPNIPLVKVTAALAAVEARTDHRVNGHWSFPEPMGKRKGVVGFVYIIRDPYLSRFYMGKKFYQKRDKTTRKWVESDWRTYKSSSGTLATMLKERPWHEFECIVLEEYTSRGDVGWAETWGLVSVKAPLDPKWYNKRVEEITWSVKNDVTPRHIERLNKVVTMHDFIGE